MKKQYQSSTAVVICNNPTWVEICFDVAKLFNAKRIRVETESDLAYIHADFDHLSEGSSFERLCKTYSKLYGYELYGYKKDIPSISNTSNRQCEKVWMPSVGLPKATKPGWVYVIEAISSDGCLYKIGKSVNPAKRLHQLKSVSPLELRLVHQIKCADMAAVELELHVQYQNLRLHGEWFKLSSTELEQIKQRAEG